MVDITLVIPIYNVEKYLEKCLLSIKNQTNKNFEVLMINDGSTDNSEKIAQEFTQNDSRYKLINQENKGLGGARNTGIDNAIGKYVLFIDSDDYIRPNTLENLYNTANSENHDIIVFNYDKVNEEGGIIHSPRHKSGNYTHDIAFHNALSLKISPMACNKFYKLHLFKENNIKFPEKTLHEDLYTTYRAFWYANSIKLVDESYYNWVIREESITSSIRQAHIDDVIKAMSSIKDFLDQNNQFEIYQNSYYRAVLQMSSVLFTRIAQSNQIKYKKYIFEQIKQHKLLLGYDEDSYMKIDKDIVDKYNNTKKKLISMTLKKETHIDELLIKELTELKKTNNEMKEIMSLIFSSKLLSFYLQLKIFFTKGEKKNILKNILKTKRIIMKKDFIEIKFNTDCCYYYIDNEYLGMLTFEKGQLSDFRAIMRKNGWDINTETIYGYLKTGLYEILGRYLNEIEFLEGNELNTRKSKIAVGADKVLKRISSEIASSGILKG